MAPHKRKSSTGQRKAPSTKRPRRLRKEKIVLSIGGRPPQPRDIAFRSIRRHGHYLGTAHGDVLLNSFQVHGVRVIVDFSANERDLAFDEYYDRLRASMYKQNSADSYIVSGFCAEETKVKRRKAAVLTVTSGILTPPGGGAPMELSPGVVVTVTRELTAPV